MTGHREVAEQAARLVPVAASLLTAATLGSEPFSLGLVAFPVVGAVILWSRPTNTIGRLLVAIGFLPALATAVPDAGIDPWLLDAVLQPFRSVAVTGMALVPFLVLVFPTGALPSPRWRWPARLAGAGVGLLVAMEVVRPDDERRNPLGVAAVDSLIVVVFPVVATGLVVFGLAALIRTFGRLRKATGDERAQLRWFASSCVPFPAIMIGVALSQDRSWLGALLIAAFTVGVAAIPAGIGVAVLKYRLYAIDIVMNKALVFGALGTFVTAVYVGVVVGIGQLVAGEDEDRLLLSLAATALVAVLFQPARQRLQVAANRIVYGQRLSPYEAVSSFGHRVAASMSLDGVLPEMAEAAALAVGGVAGRVRLVLPSGAATEAVWPAPAADLVCDRSVAVVHQGDVLGEIGVAKRRGDHVTKHDEQVLADLAAQAAIAMHNVRLTVELRRRLDELQDSRRRIVSAHDEERRRMERDLHDGAQQQLVAMKIKLGLVRSLLEGSEPDAARMVDDVASDASEAITNLRELARGLFPEVLVRQGLVAAVRAHVEKSALSAIVEAEGVDRVDLETESNVYFVIREALQNASKYAPGAGVMITLSASPAGLEFCVRDDGPGFEPGAVEEGSGSKNMRDRVEALGGSLRFESTPGGGTAVLGVVPSRVA